MEVTIGLWTPYGWYFRERGMAGMAPERIEAQWTQDFEVCRSEARVFVEASGCFLGSMV